MKSRTMLVLAVAAAALYLVWHYLMAAKPAAAKTPAPKKPVPLPADNSLSLAALDAQNQAAANAISLSLPLLSSPAASLPNPIGSDGGIMLDPSQIGGA